MVNLPGPTRSNREFRACRKLELVFALNKNRAGSACGANDSADRCSSPTAHDGADDGPDGRGNTGALDRLRGLVSALRTSFVVNFDSVAIQRSNALENCGEPVRLTIPQPDRVETERHLGPATQASTLVNVAHRAFDDCLFVLAGPVYGHSEPIARLRNLRTQVTVKNRHQAFTISHDEFAP